MPAIEMVLVKDSSLKEMVKAHDLVSTEEEEEEEEEEEGEKRVYQPLFVFLVSPPTYYVPIPVNDQFTHPPTYSLYRHTAPPCG